MKKVIIVGSEGQDGRLLFDLLTRQGHSVFGVGRDVMRGEPRGIAAPVEVLNGAHVLEAVRHVVPDEIYYLAAVHHSSQEKPDDNTRAFFRDSFNVNVNGLLNFLEAMRLHAPRARLFYAASSHVFGTPATSPQNENTPLEPACIYGTTKTTGIHCCRVYREKHKIFAVCGILYNHESAYRRPEFVTSKIVHAAVRISRGEQMNLTLGDLSARVDWGYAPDYVDAMTKILQLDRPEDFVVASGIAHTVREFVEAAFAAVQLDWKKYVKEDTSMIGKSRAGLVGDASRLRRTTGWVPTVDFSQMVRLLVDQAMQKQPDRSN